MLLSKSLSIENQRPFVRTRIARTAVLIGMYISSSANQGDAQKIKSHQPQFVYLRPYFLHETFRTFAQNQMSCEIHDDSMCRLVILSTKVDLHVGTEFPTIVTWHDISTSKFVAMLKSSIGRQMRRKFLKVVQTGILVQSIAK